MATTKAFEQVRTRTRTRAQDTRQRPELEAAMLEYLHGKFLESQGRKLVHAAGKVLERLVAIAGRPLEAPDSDGIPHLAAIESASREKVNVEALAALIGANAALKVCTTSQEAVEEAFGRNVMVQCLERVEGEPGLRVRKA